MDREYYTTEHSKGKHLNYDERMIIQLRLKDGWKPYKIAKELGCAANTVRNEIKRGTVTQDKETRKKYKAKTGQEQYTKNRKNSQKPYKWAKCREFLNYVSEKFQVDDCKWSPDACFGRALLEGKFSRSRMVCTKTLYTYIDKGLLPIKNMDLSEKLKRNTKQHRDRKNKRILGRSIEERPAEVKERKAFGNWEIDTVVGEKAGKNEVLLTLVERMSDNCICFKIRQKDAGSVMDGLKELKNIFAEKFDEVFKTITSDNGSEFARLSELEADTGTKIYYTHPYTSCERPINERHNGILRRFIPKGTCLESFSMDEIGFIEDWINQLPRKVLGYRTPEEIFNDELDRIYAA